MRFLCLSGMGTNAQILELQLSAITSKLPAQHEFVYINGEVQSDPGQGIGEIFSGPYFSFWHTPTSDQLNAAIDLIDDVIDEDGPFDIILGYSQGAGMAATYLIQDARSTHPHHHFKGAIFINANMPFDPDSRAFRLHAGEYIWVDNGQSIDFDISRDYPEVKDPHYGTLQALISEAEICQRYTSYAAPHIILPSIHVVGDADDLYRPQGCRLMEMCDQSHCDLIEFHGSHSIPKDIISTSKIVRAIESLVNEILIR